MIGLLAVVVILGAATYRGARLVARDEIFAPVRDFFVHRGWAEGSPRDGRPLSRWLWNLLSCPYCIGVWIAFAVTAVWYGWPWNSWRDGRWFLSALGVAGVQAFAQAIEDR